MVCGGAIRHQRQFARIAHNEVILSNAILRSATIGAIDGARGFPDEAHASLQSAQHLLRVRISTNWGDTDPVQTDRGAPQLDGFRPQSLVVSTNDVYSGEPVSDTIPHAHLDTPGTFVCKSGAINDRHLVPATALSDNIWACISQLRRKHATWDEIPLISQ